MIRRRISEDSGKKLSEGPKNAVPPLPPGEKPRGFALDLNVGDVVKHVDEYGHTHLAMVIMSSGGYGGIAGDDGLLTLWPQSSGMYKSSETGRLWEKVER